MNPIEAILFEPVGCLAEFGPEEFNAIAERVFGRTPDSGRSGSETYWDVVGLMANRGAPLTADALELVERYEIQAVERAHAYEDVAPALLELKALGIESIVASSLSTAAVTRFLEKSSLTRFFTRIWTRDSSGGVREAPLQKALAECPFKPDQVLFITDAAGGLQTGKQVGVNGILMMNDPDEAMKLTAHEPAGGIVSLHELPDFVRLVAAENASRPSPRR